MRDILLVVIIAGFVPVILVRPYIGVLVFAWVGYFNPHRYTWGFAYSMPIATIIGAAMILGFIFTRDKEKLPLNALMLVWIAWIVWMNVTTLFALNPESAVGEWDRAMKIQITSMMALSLMQSKKKLEYLIWVIALSVGYFGIKGGVFVALTGGNFLVWGPPGTFFEGNNGLAVALLMVLPLFWYLQLRVKDVWLKFALVISALLIILSVLGSYSRGALVGLCAVGVYLIYKSRHRWTLLALLPVVAVVFLALMPDKWFNRVDTINTYQEDSSLMGRFNAWHFAYNLASDRPLVGGGYNAFTPKFFRSYAPDPTNFHDAHSIYFEALGEHGFVGLSLFLALGWFALRHANRIRQLSKNEPELQWAYDLATLMQVCLVGYAVGGTFVGLAYFDLYYHLLAIIVLTGVIVDKRLKSGLHPNE